LEFIGLEKSDQEISKAIEASTIEKLSAMEKREGFTEKPLVMEAFFREGRAGSWKSYLAKEEIDTLINSQRAFIERFGYLK
jgi:hypothetical protein